MLALVVKSPFATAITTFRPHTDQTGRSSSSVSLRSLAGLSMLHRYIHLNKLIIKGNSTASKHIKKGNTKLSGRYAKNRYFITCQVQQSGTCIAEPRKEVTGTAQRHTICIWVDSWAGRFAFISFDSSQLLQSNSMKWSCCGAKALIPLKRTTF